MSSTLIRALPVSQASNPDHQVKLACEIGPAHLVVVECSCGQSSPMCENVGLAREWWREHVGLPAKQAAGSSAYRGD